MYSTDNHDRYPPLFVDGSPNPSPWIPRVTPYITSTAIFDFPSQPAALRSNAWTRSHALNCYVAGSGDLGYIDWTSSEGRLCIS